MPDMLTFLLYTLVFWIANACFTWIAYILIQPGQLFGSWQHTLNRMHEAHSQLLNALAKPLGDCSLCWSHMWAIMWFVFYCLFMNKIVGYWVTDLVDGRGWIIFFNVMWYLLYIPIATGLSTYLINRKAKG